MEWDAVFMATYPFTRALHDMNSNLKIWNKLGLGTMLAGGLLASCDGEAVSKDAAAASAAIASEDGGSGGGESASTEGAGGEGEGGVAVGHAANDPVAYGIALAVTEAHVAAAFDAYAAGKKEASAEMFAHPVSEVLVDMEPVFTKLGVKDFTPLLVAASDAALADKSTAEVGDAYNAIIAALRGAAAKAPHSASSAATVTLRVIADQIERASTVYRSLHKNDSYEPYLDGYGFARVAASSFARNGADIKAANPAAHARIAEAVALLEQAYPGPVRPAKLPIVPGALSGASAKVMLTTDK